MASHLRQSERRSETQELGGRLRDPADASRAIRFDANSGMAVHASVVAYESSATSASPGGAGAGHARERHRY